MKTLPKIAQAFLLFVLYTAVVISTMAISGKVIQRKTLYDKFLINLEGLAFQSTDIERSIRFYIQVLDFKPIYNRTDTAEGDKADGFLLPDNRKVFFNLSGTEQEIAGPSTHKGSTNLGIIRVRNGFKKLHSKIRSRNELLRAKYIKLNKDGTTFAENLENISEIKEQSWGYEFRVSDHMGNELLFYYTKKFSKPRY
ncbi:MAG: hypothetical protein IT291_10030 [Deltaproteobacteria bacterium]|nr:hypothetical protein [Deltaproteobacteria bacterium]